MGEEIAICMNYKTLNHKFKVDYCLSLHVLLWHKTFIQCRFHSKCFTDFLEILAEGLPLNFIHHSFNQYQYRYAFYEYYLLILLTVLMTFDTSTKIQTIQ
jgi:hypothetical protein